MKLNNFAFTFLAVAALPSFAQPQPGNPAMRPQLMPSQAMASTNIPPTPDKEKLSKALGTTFGNQMKRPELKEYIDMDVVLAALKDAYNDKPEVTDAELRQNVREFQQFMMYKRQKEAQEAGEAAKKSGEDFLAKNATADGVKTLPDGLQYKVIKEGTGDQAKSSDQVTVKYRGTLVDGTEFDKNDAFKTTLNTVIKGWQEGVPLMKVGAVFQLFIPSDLAYGTRGAPPKIPGNSVLIFDMTLIEAAPAPAPPPKPTAANENGASVVSGEIIKVPSAEELKKGAKIEVIKPGETNTMPAK